MIAGWGPLHDVLVLFGGVALFVGIAWATGRPFRAPSTCPNCGALVRVSGDCAASGVLWTRCGS